MIRVSASRDRIRRFVFAVGAYSLLGASPSAEFATVDPRTPQRELEILSWLSERPDRGPARVLTYRGPDGLRRWVQGLYRAGASYVSIYYLRGEPSALHIYLPLDALKRDEIIRIFNAEAGLWGYPPEKDEGQVYLTLWFHHD